MSSGFVPSGSSTATSPPPPTSRHISARDTEWRSARSSIETTRREQEEASQHQDGKSLYEVLQANRGDFFPLLCLRLPTSSPFL